MNKLMQNIVDEEIHSKDILTYFTRLVCTDLDDGNHCRSYVGHLLGLIRLISMLRKRHTLKAV